ncbi:MAG: DUF4349 domain-containing protein [Anaerolineales bacterium]|nr:DUF4349 domain-containing protein [Anaerolineales bacterium]
MRNWRMVGVIVLLASVLAAGCAARSAPSQATDSGAWEISPEEAPAAEASYGGGEYSDYDINYGSMERLIVREASLDLVVPDTETAASEITSMAETLDGYVISSNMYRYDEGIRASITLRVPAENLDEALERLHELATEVRSENVSGQDVTEEYVDLQSRLRHLEATEERLLVFLDEAEDTEAALAVYQQLQGVQAEMEQVKGRITYLEQSVAMSSITANLTPDKMAQPLQVAGWRPEGTLRDALQTLVRVMQFLVDALIVIVIVVIPVLLAIAVPIVAIILVIRAIVRHRRARKAATAQQPGA